MKKIIAIVVLLALVGAGIAYYFFGGNDVGSNKVYRVGILNGYDFFGTTIDGFKSKMTELGYVEGKNIIYDIKKSSTVSTEEYDQKINELLVNNPDLILSFPTEASLEAKKLAASKGVPVVFTDAFTEGIDLIDNLREPGGNITGVRFPGTDIVIKRLEILLDIFPNTKRIAIPYLKGYPNVPPQLEAVKSAAAKIPGLTIVPIPVTTPEELKLKLEAENKVKKIDAIMFMAEPVSGNPNFAKVSGKFAQDNKIYLGGTLLLNKFGFDYESLYGVLINNISVGNKAAVLADKIFKGSNAGTIPVVSADVFIQINYKFAEENGIKIPNSVISSADEVIR